jgi:hypothetical protein
LVFIVVGAIAQIARITSRSGSPERALDLQLSALRLARANQHHVEVIAGLEADLAETRRRLDQPAPER